MTEEDEKHPYLETDDVERAIENVERNHPLKEIKWSQALPFLSVCTDCCKKEPKKDMR